MKLNIIGKVIKTVLFFAVVFFALLVIASIIPFPNGLRMFVVKSGSMAPKIKSGDLIFDKKQDTYSINDIITYTPKVESKDIETITHRIIDEKDGNFITKGDANTSADSDSVTPKQIKGKYLLRVPYFGYLVAFVKTPPGLIFLIVIPGTIIVYNEMQKIINEVKTIREQKKLKKSTKSRIRKEDQNEKNS